ncbi:MAG: F0F1 ATP synthase subunit B [Flavobacteriaceae bacterium]
MELITPAIGLIFWTTLTFGILYFLLKKMAWGPILDSVSERENTITNSLAEADKARQEMLDIKSDNDKVLKEARVERDLMLKDAREMKENLINEAKEEAQLQANKMIEQAKSTIQNEKVAAISDMKTQMGELSVNIAEKVVKGELADKNKQLQLIEDLLKDVTLN